MQKDKIIWLKTKNEKNNKKFQNDPNTGNESRASQ